MTNNGSLNGDSEAGTGDVLEVEVEFGPGFPTGAQFMKKTIRRVVRDVPQHWVGDGFPVRSLFSYAEGSDFDPFLLLDYAGPYEFAPDEAKRGVGEHPHRGFETVTILYNGELEHGDSIGSHGTIGSGDVQWMTAAAGIVHEEFHSRRFAKEGGTLEMVQLWVNLPASAKAAPPKYQDLRSSQIPVVSLPREAGTARVIAGELLQVTGPAETFTPMNVWDVNLNADGLSELAVPDNHIAIIVVQSGSIVVTDQRLNAVELALMSRDGTALQIRSHTASRLLVLTGEPIGEPVVGQGPFVMNTREEIHQAMQDFRAGRMGRLSAR